MRLAAVLLVAVSLTVLPVAADEPTSSVTALTAAQDGRTLVVQGQAEIVDAGNAVVATDPGDDAAYEQLGGELTSAGINYDAGSQELVFTLKVADAMPTFTLPEVVHYHWYVAISNGPSLARFQLQALRSSQYAGAAPGIDPVFRVVRCSNAATSSCFTTAAHVDGTMAGGIVQWRVPASVLGAVEGSTIDGFYTPDVLVQPGASGAAFAGGAAIIDAMDTAAYVVGPVVQLAATAPGLAVEAAQFHAKAEVAEDGSFAGAIDATRMRTGDYLVWARACHGLASSCGTASTEVFYDEFPDLP